MISRELQIGRAGELLALADILLHGLQGFATDQGVGYDVVFEHKSRLVRLQVKTTQGHKAPNGNYRCKVYQFHVRRAGKSGNRVYDLGEFDAFALVTLDTRKVYYVPFQDRLNRSWIFRDREQKYSLTHGKCAPYIQDYSLPAFLEWLK